MIKVDALLAFAAEYTRDKPTTSGARRVLRFCKVLGLTHAETIDTLYCLCFCDVDGAPFPGIQRVW